MNKKQMVNEIIDLYDENEALKRKIKELTEPKMCEAKNDCVDTKETLFDVLNKKANSLLFNDIFHIGSWSRFDNETIEVTEDAGEFNFLSFEQWIKKVGIRSMLRSNYEYLLNEFSINDIKSYFIDDFRNYYQKLLNDKKMEIVRDKKEN